MADAETLTITFPKPVAFGGIEYPKVDLREPNAGEMRETDGLSGYAADIKIVSVVGAMPEAAVRLIPARQFLRATRFIGGFLKPAPETGDDA